MPIEVRRLSEDDVVTGFKSGDHRLDNFLRRHALPNARARLSATWVAAEESMIVGFVTVVPGAVSAASLASVVEGLPPYQTPVLVLARMATHKKFHGRGIGRLLFEQVFSAARAQAEFGCAGVFTDAKPGSVGFYARFGFVALAAPASPDATTPMFLPLRGVPTP